MTSFQAFFRHRNLITTFSVLLVSSFCLLGSQNAHAQVYAKKNTIYLELGGNAALYSFNYDRLLANNISARAGIGIFSIEDDLGISVDITAVPVTVNYIVGKDRNNFELGLGILYVSGNLDIGTVSSSGVLGTAVLGYRHQKPEGGVFYKASVTPIFGQGEFLFWVGAGIGYTL